GGAGGAVAFAGEKFGGEPALVFRGVEADEVADRGDVFADAPELLTFFAGRGTGIAGADGIDEDHVGEVQPGIFVVDPAIGRRGDLAVFEELDPLWPGGAHVQPNGGRAGAAVEDEGDGTIVAVGGVFDFFIGDEKEVGFFFSV